MHDQKPPASPPRQTQTREGLPASGHIRAKHLAQALSIGESTVWKWAAENRMPKPVRLSARVTVWDARSIHQWLAARSEQ
jgi:prophage regulatory protein